MRILSRLSILKTSQGRRLLGWKENLTKVERVSLPSFFSFYFLHLQFPSPQSTKNCCMSRLPRAGICPLRRVCPRLCPLCLALWPGGLSGSLEAVSRALAWSRGCCGTQQEGPGCHSAACPPLPRARAPSWTGRSCGARGGRWPTRCFECRFRASARQGFRVPPVLDLVQAPQPYALFSEVVAV